MATGDLHTKFCADLPSGSRDVLVDRQTDRRVDHNTPHNYWGGVLTEISCVRVVNRRQRAVCVCVCVCVSLDPRGAHLRSGDRQRRPSDVAAITCTIVHSWANHPCRLTAGRLTQYLVRLHFNSKQTELNDYEVSLVRSVFGGRAPHTGLYLAQYFIYTL